MRKPNRQAAEEEVTAATLRYAAMSLLARREHAWAELRRKMVQRFGENELLDPVLQNLADEALQSDERFTEAFLSTRLRKGQGPLRIRRELEQRQVDPVLIARHLEGVPEEEWRELAREACLKKYGAFASEARERAKQMRFLQYRGFSTEQIRSLWKDAEL